MLPRTSPSSLIAGLRRSAFVYLVAVIAVVASERMFWYWTTDPVSHLGLAAFYSAAAGPLVWAIGRYGVDSWWSLLLATPLFSLVTEGVITPVTYSGGPFVPVFPAWFAFWHGILAVGLLVFGVRHLLMTGRFARLALVSAGVGVFWGLWSTTLWLPENLEDPELVEENGGPLQLLDAGEFALYAATFTAVLAAGHWLIGYVWPTEFRPTRRTERAWAIVLVLWAGLWTVVFPWALPMFLAYAWLQRWGLRRHERVATEPSLLARLAGPTPVVGLLALAPMAIAAAGVYAIAWSVEPSHDVLSVIFWGTIALQTGAGGVVSVMALRRSGRGRETNEPVAVLPGGSVREP